VLLEFIVYEDLFETPHGSDTETVHRKVAVGIVRQSGGSSFIRLGDADAISSATDRFLEPLLRYSDSKLTAVHLSLLKRRLTVEEWNQTAVARELRELSAVVRSSREGPDPAEASRGIYAVRISG
jgi:hypothetical protein